MINKAKLANMTTAVDTTTYDNKDNDDEDTTMMMTIKMMKMTMMRIQKHVLYNDKRRVYDDDDKDAV